ncbi:Epididymal-specific lipocalin-9 [Manis javanica]|nr:Epididymal-specific lipocalin-9 [Manis javanica]
MVKAPENRYNIPPWNQDQTVKRTSLVSALCHLSLLISEPRFPPHLCHNHSCPAWCRWISCNTRQPPSFSRRTTGTVKMQILLLTLVLGLVCAAQEQPVPQNDVLISIELNTLQMAASNKGKITDGGPFHAYVRQIELNPQNGKIFFRFFVKENGECVRKVSEGKKTEDDVYKIKYSGENEFKILYKNENAMIAEIKNTDAEGMETNLIALFGKESDISEETVAKFRKITADMGIPEDNIVNIISSDDCPEIY